MQLVSRTWWNFSSWHHHLHKLWREVGWALFRTTLTHTCTMSCTRQVWDLHQKCTITVAWLYNVGIIHACVYTHTHTHHRQWKEIYFAYYAPPILGSVCSSLKNWNSKISTVTFCKPTPYQTHKYACTRGNIQLQILHIKLQVWLVYIMSLLNECTVDWPS